MRLLTCLAVLASIGCAQKRNITVQNLAPYARYEWATAVVPFRRGEVEGLPDLHAGDLPTVWHAIGSRWSD